MSESVRLSTDRTVVVDGSYHWRLIATDPPPRAVKVQLVNRAFGVATYGTWYPGSTFTHWAPLPTFAHEPEGACVPERRCERHARGLGGCVAGFCTPPALEGADGVRAAGEGGPVRRLQQYQEAERIREMIRDSGAPMADARGVPDGVNVGQGGNDGR